MKSLFLLRHAKSSWEDPDLKDFERPLSDRGLADVPTMAGRFNARSRSIACIITSPATRAKSTAQMFASAIHLPLEDIASNPELYFAGAAMFLKATHQLDDSCASAMLVGHNPAITEFANHMCNANIDNIPTCGLVELSLPIEDWSEASFAEAELVDFDYPKKTT